MVRKHKSEIERDQLGPHLRQLVQVGFLASWTIAKAARADGFVVTFRPGPVFFADYHRFYRGRSHRNDVQYEIHDDRRATAEPLKVAYLFAEKRTGQPLKAIPYVSSKEVETAKDLLAEVPFDQMPDFLNYALAAAKRTNYPVQTLGGIRRYLPEFLEHLQRRATIAAAQADQRIQQREAHRRAEYDRFRRSACDRLFTTLPAEEQENINQLARAGTPAFRQTGSVAGVIASIERARIVADRYPDRILTYEKWTDRVTKSDPVH